ADHIAFGIGHVSDGGGLQLPASQDRAYLLFSPLVGHHEHPLLRLRKENLVRRHPRLAHGHESDLYVHPRPPTGRHILGGGDEPRGTKVLDADDVPPADQLQRSLRQELLRERISALHHWTLCIALLGELRRRESSPVNAVATGPGS